MRNRIKKPTKIFRNLVCASVFCSMLVVQMTEYNLLSVSATDVVTEQTTVAQTEITEQGTIIATELVTEVTTEQSAEVFETEVVETESQETESVDTPASSTEFISLFDSNGDMTDNGYITYDAETSVYKPLKQGYYARFVVDFSVFTGDKFIEFIDESGNVSYRVSGIPNDLSIDEIIVSYMPDDLSEVAFQHIDESNLESPIASLGIDLYDINTNECYESSARNYCVYSTDEVLPTAIIDATPYEAPATGDIIHDNLGLTFTCVEKSSTAKEVVLNFEGSIRDGYGINNMLIYKYETNNSEPVLYDTNKAPFIGDPSHVKLDYVFHENGKYRVKFLASQSNFYYFDIEITGIGATERVDYNDYDAPILTIETGKDKGLTVGSPFKIKATTNEICNIIIDTKATQGTTEAIAEVNTNGIYKVTAVDKAGNTTTEYVTVTAFGDGTLPSEGSIVNPMVDGEPIDENPLHAENLGDKDIWGDPDMNNWNNYSPTDLGIDPNKPYTFEGSSVIASGLSNMILASQSEANSTATNKDKLPQAGMRLAGVIAVKKTGVLKK